MIQYQVPAYRPPATIRRNLPTRLGQAQAAMTFGDWLLLAGGAVVGGVGVNMAIGGFRRPMNAVPILLGAVLTAVGASIFFDKIGRVA